HDYLMGAVQTTRGCPFDCEFCDVIHLFGRQPRHKAIDSVLAEVAALEKLGMRMVFFCDDNFIGRPKYAKDLLKALIPLNNSFDRPIGFTTQLTINVADDEEMLELLADANFHWVLIGLESPREACLREANKPQNVRMNLIEAVRRVHSYGVLVKGNMIVGFDHDDQDIFREIYDFLLECGIVNTGLSLLKAYPGTPLLARMQRDGRLIEVGDDIYSDVTRSVTNIIPKQMSRVELFEGYKWLFEKLRSWDYFEACANTMIDSVQRAPNVPRKGTPDPEKVQVVRKALDDAEPDVKRTVKGVLQKVWRKAPFLMERMVSTTFRFGGVALASRRALEALQERIDVEASDSFKPEIIHTSPPIPAGFKEALQWKAFPTSYELLTKGLKDTADLPEGLIRVWKSFLIRWHASFESFEDFHFEHLRELCDRTIEEANTGQFERSHVLADTDGLSGVQLRRLANEVLVSVEQDLRGVEVNVDLVPVTIHTQGPNGH
ncbi:MAG: radical SAM protein, partial [Phycisphaerae bacterium]